MVGGGYPEVIADAIDPTNWYLNYISTFIERDMRQLKNINNLAQFTKLFRMCAGRTGQILNMLAKPSTRTFFKGSTTSPTCKVRLWKSGWSTAVVRLRYAATAYASAPGISYLIRLDPTQ